MISKLMNIISSVVFAGGLLIPIAEAGLSQTSPPPAAPQRRTGGESLPPLPLPGTPLRRSERKRPPSPPVLVSEVYMNQSRQVDLEGKTIEWTPSRNLSQFMNFVNTNLRINFNSMQTDMGNFDFNPVAVPVLYFGGDKSFEFTPELEYKLRIFLESGGSVIFDASENSKEFRDSAIQLTARLFPDKKIKDLPLDHPIFSCYFKLDNVKYEDAGKTFSNAPRLFGVDIGCRTAVIITPVDLNCDWDNRSGNASYLRVEKEDSRKLGSNMLTYMIAEYEYGKTLWGRGKKVYYQQNEGVNDNVVIGKIRHNGDWDAAQNSVTGLLGILEYNTTMPVKFREADINLNELNDPFDYPVVYMSGLDEFELSEKEVSNLRSYLSQGGVLIADATAGRQSFDLAFRREMKRVLPDDKLEVLPDDNAVYRNVYDISNPKLTPMYQGELEKGGSLPKLEAIVREGRPVVIYSPLDFGTGIDGNQPNYCRGYAADSARKIGVNLVMYAYTH